MRKSICSHTVSCMRMGLCMMAFLLAVYAAGAQTTQASAQPSPGSSAVSQAPSQPVPNLRATVNEVSLDFVAHDKKNHSILDLTPADVTVTDNGTPVTLSGFHLVKGADTSGYLVTFVFDRFGGAIARNARQLADRVLKLFPDNNYSIDVFDLGNRLRLIQGFTSDHHRVEDAITMVTDSRMVTAQSDYNRSIGVSEDLAEGARAKAAQTEEKNLISVARTGADLNGRHVDIADRELARTELKALEDTHTIAHEQHTPVALAALLALVRSQEKLNQRKALIYFTTNRQMDSAARAMLKTIEAAAGRSGVTIYTIDMDALDVGAQYQMEYAIGNAAPPFEPGKTALGCGAGGCTYVQNVQMEGPAPISGTPTAQGPSWGVAQDIAVMTDFHRQSNDYSMFAAKSPMADLAVKTGGIYIDAQVNVKRPLNQMLEDMTTYYAASYAPPIKEYDGSFHAIAVTTLRKDVHIKAKSGYYAVAPGADGSVRPFEVPLLKSLTDAKLPTDVRFDAGVLRFGDLVEGNTDTVVVEIPLSGLQVKEDASTNLYSAHVTVAVRIRDKSGVVIERFGEDITKRGALEELDRGDAGSIELHRSFFTTPGQYVLEVAVADQLSGKTGAQRIPFTVSAAHDPVSVSDMVLVRRLDPVHEEDGDDSANPLRYDKDEIMPNMTGELGEKPSNVSFFFILHPDPASKDAPTLDMQVIHNGSAGRRTALPLRINASGDAVPYLASFGSHVLSPGDYQVKAFFNEGGKEAVQQIAFHVAGEPAEAEGSAPAKEVEVALNRDEASVHAAPDSAPGALAIVASANPIPPLGKAEASQLLADARQAAVDYADSLPNFLCVQVTNRSVDRFGDGNWKLHDTIIELLRYRDKIEDRVTLEINGKPSNVDRAGLKGASSTGEFGGVLRSIFGDASKADFTWKETDMLGGQPVQVFDYRVAQANSIFNVVDTSGRAVIAGFHGQVFIDSAARRVRRVTLIADDLPRAFSTHSTSIGVDYDYVAINGHDYLLPVSAEMRLTKGSRGAVLNTIEFRDYKHFGSSMRILGYSPVDGSTAPAANSTGSGSASAAKPESGPR